MNTTTRNVFIGIVALIVIVLLGYYAWREHGTSAPSDISTSTTPISTTTVSTIQLGTTSTTTGSYTITQAPVYSRTQAPSYKTPLTFNSSVSADVQASEESQFAAIQTTLASDPTDYSSWLTLGILRQDTGDYQGAVADWAYITEIYPTDPTAYANLANLYATYLNQPDKAISNYREAIALQPTKQVSYYQNLAQIYVSQGDTADAKAILQQGISAQVVGYQNLQTELASMQ